VGIALIHRLDVINFQSVKKAEVELAPFTAVIGESDQGKSALLRALESVVNNRAGNDFVTHGASFSSVEVEVDDHEIAWDKGTNTNRYIADGVVYDKVGRGVPEDVTKLLDLNPASLAGQFDRPYLLFESGAEVSQIIGELTNIALLYEAVRLANGDKTHLSGLVNTVQGSLDEVVKQEAELDADVASLSFWVSTLAAQDADCRQLLQQVIKLETLCEHKQSWEAEQERLASVAMCQRLGAALTKAVDELELRQQTLSSLTGFISARSDLEAAVFKGKCPTLPTAQVERYEALVNAVMDLRSRVSFRDQLEHDLGVMDGQVETEELKLQTEKSQLAAMLTGLDVCPFSGGTFFDECKERLEI
jgi:hypothetical protein